MSARDEIQSEALPSGRGEAAPSGSLITLVFVDLVNSTALKAALPGADITARNRAYFATILTPYRQRVEVDLSAFGGRVVKTAGDGHFLVFASAAQAAQWAAALQARSSAEPILTPLGPLRVRIGMHTGAPLSDPQDVSDYIGHEVEPSESRPWPPAGRSSSPRSPPCWCGRRASPLCRCTRTESAS